MSFGAGLQVDFAPPEFLQKLLRQQGVGFYRPDEIEPGIGEQLFTVFSACGDPRAEDAWEFADKEV